MSFQGLQAKYSRLMQENASWKLLRSDNSYLILAFLEGLFSEENEVDFQQAKILLEQELIKSQASGIWETQTNAGSYLNQWIRAGWLREMDNKLSRTDACEVAFRFCKGLEERSASTTSSHLRIVQDAIRDFTVAISPDIEQRTQILEQKRDELQREIDDLQAGVVVQLSERQQKERIKEIYQLASVLTGDFRLIEDQIRELDQALRVDIIEGDASKGEVLQSVLEKEAFLSETDAGSAFESFFELLSDTNRSLELREQIQALIRHPSAEHLSVSQRQFLGRLIRELNRESDRVFEIRRRTQESLRHFVESGNALENRKVDQLIAEIEKIALQLKDSSYSLNQSTSLSLPVGAIKIHSPESMRLRMPDEKIDTRGVEEQTHSQQLNPQMLAQLDTIQIKNIARKTKTTLEKQGPMSLAKLTEFCPIDSGLEELVAYLRVAKAIKATQIAQKETVSIKDPTGHTLQATIPVYLLSADLFPQSIEELVL